MQSIEILQQAIDKAIWAGKVFTREEITIIQAHLNAVKQALASGEAVKPAVKKEGLKKAK